MVRDIIRPKDISDSNSQDVNQLSGQFPVSAPAANPVFYRTYSRKLSDDRRESWQQVSQRTIQGMADLGQFTSEERALVEKMQQTMRCLPSGRWLWVGGTGWIERPENFSGAYNCTSTNVVDWKAFGLMMDLAMMGCGTGAVLESKYTNQLPAIRNRLVVKHVSEIGTTSVEQRQEKTQITAEGNQVTIRVGDSRQGWVASYQGLLELCTDDRFTGNVEVTIDLSHVRPAGERLKGFGGMANPVRLPGLYERCAKILDRAIGRQLTSIECCLLIDEAAACVVAGNIRRSAGMRQGGSEDTDFAGAKENLWQQDAEGNWRIDPDRDALRMANHTRVYHHQPTAQECIDAVRKQFYSGEGAIQYAPEAIARSNADILITPDLKTEFLQAYNAGQGQQWIQARHPEMSPQELEHRLGRYGLNPCVTADTWIHTEDGARQVRDLVGKQHSTYVNGELFSTTSQGFFFTGVKPVVKLETKEGHTLRLTLNHKVLKVTAQTQKAQYTDWVEVSELQIGDRILLHNHRDLQSWDGQGTSEEGWLLGNLIGDGCFLVHPPSHTYQAKLRYWGNTQVAMKDHALALMESAFPVVKQPQGFYHAQNRYYEVGSAKLAHLARQFGVEHGHKKITPAIEQASYGFYCGFLQGLFDADGSIQGTQVKGVSVRLAQSDLPLLQAVQRMLLRLGIASTVYQNRRVEQVRSLPNAQRQPADHHCKAQHELVIANDNLAVFEEVVGFHDPEKVSLLQTLLAGYKRNLNRERFAVSVAAIVPDGVEAVYDCTVPGPHRFDANGLVAHNCGEILGENFHCNLSEVHLNQLDPFDYQEQEEAFTAGALSVAALLNHTFQEPRYQYSRELDPIVGSLFHRVIRLLCECVWRRVAALVGSGQTGYSQRLGV